MVGLASAYARPLIFLALEAIHWKRLALDMTTRSRAASRAVVVRLMVEALAGPGSSHPSGGEGRSQFLRADRTADRSLIASDQRSVSETNFADRWKNEGRSALALSKARRTNLRLEKQNLTLPLCAVQTWAVCFHPSMDARTLWISSLLSGIMSTDDAADIDDAERRQEEWTALLAIYGEEPGSSTWQRPHIARPLPRQC